LLALQI